MKEYTFYIVDVFAEEKYAGNQLAVFRDGESLSQTARQRFAKEMNYSETTFILSDEKRDGGYDVRIFTPEEELPFAGHPTLGTAYIIQREIIKKPVDQVILNLNVGPIPVNFSYSDGDTDIMWMKQNAPTFGSTLTREQIGPVLGLETDDIDSHYPIEEVSTGVFSLIVPVNTLSVLKKISVDKNRYYSLIEDIQAKGILVFCPETRKPENDLSVRFFADYYGVPEDPATGAANGCLAGYLIKNNYFNKNEIDIKVEQGYEINRKSLLYIKSSGVGDKIEISVGGRVKMIARGEFI
jgi:trans-2,3-dihydro-3-hydroxyanthranilate isomerase